ncbi:MAG TPA: metalloregulator ArsR/SmtB family transcription factor [Pseudolabrys sp.]|nr:metalloregulator ArsR/SmtB family transcription factor [Pseudolabrys sp.]
MTKPALVVLSHAVPSSASRMGPAHALVVLAALGQSTRLAVLRLLMRAEPGGLPAGDIAEHIGCPANTLSSHLSILARSGLIRGSRDGRSIVYRAEVETMRRLVGFLIGDCCEGHPELCDLRDAIDKADCGCGPPKPKRRRRSR